MSRPILVVDDSSTVRLQVKRILSQAGHEVLAFSSGREALDRVQSLCPALLILDIQMPDPDGYAVCQELKHMGPPWCDLPIVFLTSLQSHALSLLGHEMGAYLRKPVCGEELLAVVRGFLESDSSPLCQVPARGSVHESAVQISH